MAKLLEVAVSGTVGKQVVPTTNKAVLDALILTPSAANATLKIRDGNASGEVVLFIKAFSAQGSLEIHGLEDVVFTKGMHVKVIGTNAVAYLVLE